MVQFGTRVGPYEIVAPLGEDGLGEVYRPHDTKLGRDAARSDRARGSCTAPIRKDYSTAPWRLRTSITLIVSTGAFLFFS